MAQPHRIVHLGLGAFARAHVFDHTADAGGWAVTGVAPRSRDVVAALARQHHTYTILVRGADGDRAVPRTLVDTAYCAADDPAPVLAALADPAATVVTTTITEKGYRIDPHTRRLADPLPADLAADLTGTGPFRTAVGLLVAGLRDRYRRHGAPVTLVSCDNLADNGHVLRAAVDGLAERTGDTAFADWVHAAVRCPRTVVDRITPATTDGDRRRVAALTGHRDDAAVVTEPYRQWVIEDDFAAARPDWATAGALLVPDTRPYERAKLRLLNAAHTLLAYLGRRVGARTVADAVGHDGLASLLDRFLRTEAVPALPPSTVDAEGFVAGMLVRFANPAIDHRLDQIAVDGTAKLAERVLPTLRALTGRAAVAPLIVAGWCADVVETVEAGRRPTDPRAADLVTAATGAAPVRAVLDVLDPALGDDLRAPVLAAAEALRAGVPPTALP
ncbi:mannitol dehydrogenase family protein [Actinocatenispora rupis]|uniref:Mannitol dehydrogenase n=1 Tax=Actinocatenispora rupis TaxID=519421 RepID=A0A8J3J2H5_9ACTN|nr:mannitol dehydrogenase family protein [Actinocatenispora rupis]GID10787.1 mannitol dehydrogenase [Actinocatenispora rupis]